MEEFSAKTVKKYVAGVLFGLICLVFVFFGLPQQMGSIGGGIVADVNGEVVSLADYRDLRQRLQQSQGFNLSGLSGQFREMMRERLNEQTLQYLVNDILFFQGAQQEGIRVADAEVRDIIVEVPAFNEDGVFLASNYRQYLKNTRKSAGDFEHELRMQKKRARVQALIAQVTEPTEQQLSLEKELKKTEVNVEFLRLSERSMESQLPVAGTEITARDGDADFQKEVKSEYDTNAAQYKKEHEQVKAQHILIKVDASKENADSVAKNKAEKIRKDLTRENFAEQAKKFSEDTVSGAKGGDLGFFPRGRMVPEFEQAAFSMKPGQLSQPIKSQFGYHIILVNEKKEGDFESVKKEVATKLIRAEKYKAAEKEISEALANGKLDDMVKKYKLTWTETGKFDLGSSSIPRLGNDDAFFSEVAALLAGKKASEKFLEKDDSQYVMRLKSKTTNDKIDEDQIRAGLSNELTAMVTNDWLEGLRKSGNVKVNRELMR